MEGGGSQLDPGFSQQDTPRLIVEDSQPEGAGAEEDGEQACLGVLARRLPARRSPSPVLSQWRALPARTPPDRGAASLRKCRRPAGSAVPLERLEEVEVMVRNVLLRRV